MRDMSIGNAAALQGDSKPRRGKSTSTMMRRWSATDGATKGSFTLQRYKGLGEDGRGAALGDDARSEETAVKAD